MRRLAALLLLIGALLLLGVSVALGADTAGTDMGVDMMESGKGDDHGKVTSQRLVDDAQILQTAVREPVVPADVVVIGR